MSIRKISEFVEASSPQNSDKLLIERNGSGKSITVGNLLNDVVTRTRVNLLRPSMPTKTYGGVTCTNNNDGTYTVSGKATSEVWLALGSLYLPKGVYRLVGNKANSGTHLKLHNSGWSSQCTDLGSGANIETNGDTYELSIYVSSGSSVVGNVLIKPMITNDLSATYDDFVPYDDSFVTGINSGIKLDLLWTNSSPESAFAGQTVSLDLRKYKMVYVVTRRIVSNNNFHGSKILKKGESGQIFSYLNGYGLVDREITDVSDTGVTFGVGVKEGTTDNEYGIPIYIYGIK